MGNVGLCKCFKSNMNFKGDVSGEGQVKDITSSLLALGGLGVRSAILAA